MSVLLRSSKPAVETTETLAQSVELDELDVEATVLIVEDSPTQALHLQLMLDRLGLRTLLASNGAKGIAMARHASPDLIILDLELPDLTGDQVLARLKADPLLRDIPVVIASSLSDVERVAWCIAMGAEDYLPKPLNKVLLRARLAACLEKKRLREQEAVYLRQVEEERARFEELLHVILPTEVARELQTTGMVKPRRYENVAVLFADVVGFTPYCNAHPPEEVFVNLQLMAEAYENLALRYGLQKIKTSGDAFLATAGLFQMNLNPVLSCVQCALEMLPAARELPAQWEVRVGIHVGPVMAGVVGQRQYLFDIWGNTVNTAQRIESYGQSSAVNLSAVALGQVSACCEVESLGMVTVKGKGDLEIFRVIGVCR
ncbi:MAG: response regulator [Anaerolineae bacterium]|nr:response regulator [Anaerolineae bacterium]